MVPHHPIATGITVHYMTEQSAHYEVQQSAQTLEGALRVTGLANIPTHQISTTDFVVQVPSFYSLKIKVFIKQDKILNKNKK